jgi:hypothetical protein
MLDFSDTPYGRAAVPATPVPPVPAPRAVPAPTATTDLLDAPGAWSWQQLRDYILRAVSETHGPAAAHGETFKQNAIFQSFHKRHGPLAGPIARFAFEDQGGYWRSAPVTPARFTKGCDPYFAEPIAARLAHG